MPKRRMIRHGGGGSTLHADVTHIGGHERFTLINAGVGKFALRTFNGHYVVAEGGGGGTVNANRTAIGAWETFQFVNLGGTYGGYSPGRTYAIRSVDGSYLRATGGGGGSLDIGAPWISSHEQFTVVDAGNGTVAIHAPSGHYLRAENGGGAGLRADQTQIGDHERFRIWAIANGKAVLRTYVGNHFVVAEGGGGGAMNANRTLIGPWETFDLVDLQGGH